MRILALLTLLFTASTSFATILNSPFDQHDDRRFDNLESTTGDITFTTGGFSQTKSYPMTNVIGAGKVTEAKIVAQSTEGLHLKRIARVTYDVATDLGTIAAHGLGVTLPANTVITRSWIYIVTQFVDAGSGTVALSCEDANNIKTATDLTGSAAGALVEGASTGATSAMTSGIAAACEVTATVAGAAQTAGKLIVFIEYVVVE